MSEEKCKVITIPLEFYAEYDIDQASISQIKEWVEETIRYDRGYSDFPHEQAESPIVGKMTVREENV